MTTRRFAVLALGAAALIGLFLYAPTFGSGYAYDDIDYLNHAADVLAGRASFWGVPFRPQGEHFVPVLRLLLTASARLFGTNATPLRLLVFASHVLSALFLALAARRLLRDDVAGLAAGVLYVLPCGFSSMWLWFPSGGCVPIGIAGVTGALAAIVHADTLGRRRAGLLAAAGCVFALACDNSLVPLLSAPFFLSVVERRRAGDRRLVSGLETFLVSLAALALLATRLFYTRLTGVALHTEPIAALKRFAFLACAAPFRYLFPGPSVVRPLGITEWFPKMESAFGVLIALAAAAVLLAVLTPASRRGAVAAVATLPAGIGFLALVGVARWNFSYEELFDGDRYFFPLLVPASLLAAAAVAAIRERLRGNRELALALVSIGFAALGLETVLHRRAMVSRVSWDVYAAHEKRLATLTRLAGMLADAARALPPDAPALAVPDTNLFFPEIHNGRISTRFLLTISNRRPTPAPRSRARPGRRAGCLDPEWRLRRLGTRDRRETLVRRRERSDPGPPPPGSRGLRHLRAGRGRRLRVLRVVPADAVDGSARRRPRRSSTAPKLRVEFACPVDALAARAAAGARAGDRRSLEDAGGGEPDTSRHDPARGTPRGAPTTSRCRRTSGPGTGTTRSGSCSRRRSTWRPAGVLAGSRDERDLSVEVFRIGFVKE